MKLISFEEFKDSCENSEEPFWFDEHNEQLFGAGMTAVNINNDMFIVQLTVLRIDADELDTEGAESDDDR